MPNKRISEASSKPSLAPTDMLPLAAQGDSTAYHITGENLVNSLPAATSAVAGVVELATAAESQSAVDATRAVTPASLMAGIKPLHLAPGFCKAEWVHVAPPTFATLTATFTAAFGRQPADGDIMVVRDAMDSLYLLVFDAALGSWVGTDLTAQQFVSYE